MLSVNAISQSIARQVADRQHVRIYSVTMGQDDTVSRLTTEEACCVDDLRLRNA